MRRVVLCAAVVCLLQPLLGCADSNRSGVSIQQYASANELKERIDARAVTVVDTFESATYERGHIPDAINCDYEQMDSLAANRLPADKSTPLVFYCAGGMCPVGSMAANKAVKLGYTNVAVYKGGIKGWRAAGLPVETGPH